MDKALELFSRIDILVNGESVNIFSYFSIVFSGRLFIVNKIIEILLNFYIAALCSFALNKCILILRYPLFFVQNFSGQVLLPVIFSCVRLIGFIVVSAKMIH